MTLLANSYGKGRVRIMRVHRAGDLHTVSELSVTVMLHGGFNRAYTHADNRAVIATDTIKNIVNIIAREQVGATPEAYCGALGGRFLQRYPQIERVVIDTLETRWTRLHTEGVPHPHAFVLDANGQPTVQLDCTRHAHTLCSGIAGATFMKSTGSGWSDYVMDDYTTLAPTQDRIAATSMTARWRWSAPPPDITAANAAILGTMLQVFATTYSHGVQDSLARMGEAALQAAPEVEEVALSCPNKHYLPIDFTRFGLVQDGTVFTPTDEPHGQIECTIRR